MKKLKLICSAIAALSVLALAGCDLEIPEKSKVYYNSNVTFDKGVASAADWTSGLGIGFSPMYGSWKYSSYKGEDKVIEETVIQGAEKWWTDRVDSEATTLLDGETITIYLECVSGSTAALCMHAHNDSGWWWYNPGDGNFWGDDSLGATYETTYKTSGARTLAEGMSYKFEISRNGNDLSWNFVSLSAEEDD